MWSPSSEKTYLGFTWNLDERLKSHNELGTKCCTIKFRPWQLVESFPFEEKKDAKEMEQYFKSGRGREEIKIVLKKRGLA